MEPLISEHFGHVRREKYKDVERKNPIFIKLLLTAWWPGTVRGVTQDLVLSSKQNCEVGIFIFIVQLKLREALKLSNCHTDHLAIMKWVHFM